MTTLLAEPGDSWQERSEELLATIDRVTAAMADEYGLMLLTNDGVGYHKLQAQFKEANDELSRIWRDHPPEAVLP